MSTPNLALRNLQTEAARLTSREITLADGSTVSFREAITAIGNVFVDSHVDENMYPSYAALGVQEALSIFYDDSNFSETTLRAAQYLDKDLAVLANSDVEQNLLDRSAGIARDVYNDNDQSDKEKQILKEWLNILKSEKNFNSAVQGVLKVVLLSKVVPYAQAAYQKLSPSVPDLL